MCCGCGVCSFFFLLLMRRKLSSLDEVKSGELLCRMINKIKPKIVRKVEFVDFVLSYSE